MREAGGNREFTGSGCRRDREGGEGRARRWPSLCPPPAVAAGGWDRPFRGSRRGFSLSVIALPARVGRGSPGCLSRMQCAVCESLSCSWQIRSAPSKRDSVRCPGSTALGRARASLGTAGPAGAGATGGSCAPSGSSACYGLGA